MKKFEINKTGKLIVYRVPPTGDYTFVTLPDTRTPLFYNKLGELER